MTPIHPMEFQAYIPGIGSSGSAPLARFLPQVEDGVISNWLSRLNQPSAWVLDPFGFSPKLALEAARSGFRVLVTANNPINRFLLEMFANPPAMTDFSAALADLSAMRKGEERLGAHIQALYQTTCELCGEKIQAQAFLWRKGENIPHARIYTCKHCGDSGERPASDADLELALKIAETDPLHRSRAFEKVAALNDPDRTYAEEAIVHYLPRPLYALTTIINRIESLNLSAERRRALNALILLACDAGNTLWSHPVERTRPKQLITPANFRENNLWTVLETGANLWMETSARVPIGTWPARIPDKGGILSYEGRLKDLANIVKKEIPIAAVIGSVPRPNQAFWTLSALWAGWLWGRDAVEPYKVALRRRRYDWAWNATALNSAFNHLNSLLPQGTDFFALLPEPEPSFLSSALSAAGASGFELRSIALRTEHDAAQILWKNGAKSAAAQPARVDLEKALLEHLQERAEPSGYLHLHAAGLAAMAEGNAIKKADADFDETLRHISAQLQNCLGAGGKFIHYSASENIETGLWGAQPAAAPAESLSDRVEVEMVNYLQKNKQVIYLDIENDLYPKFKGLMTPSKGLIYAILNSYAEKNIGGWVLRKEDEAHARRSDINTVFALLESIGRRLDYETIRQERSLQWLEHGKPVKNFSVMASALVNRAIQSHEKGTVLVIPGGRAALIAYKQERDPSLAERLKQYRFVKFRFLRTIAEVPVLNRDSFESQIASDPIEHSSGQMMMF